MMTKKMSELVAGMRFQDEEGNVWTLAEKNSKAKTVILIDANGKSRPHGLTTFNKKYTEADGIIAVVNVEDISAEAPAEVAETEIPITEEPKPKKERKARKRTKKTFEELVADIPAPANVRFIRSAKGAVHVKMGTDHNRLFGYTGTGIVVSNSALIDGLQYIKKTYGYVLAPTADNMAAIFHSYYEQRGAEV